MAGVLLVAAGDGAGFIVITSVPSVAFDVAKTPGNVSFVLKYCLASASVANLAPGGITNVPVGGGFSAEYTCLVVPGLSSTGGITIVDLAATDYVPIVCCITFLVGTYMILSVVKSNIGSIITSGFLTANTHQSPAS